MSVKLADERAIICTTDGNIYPCVAEAAKHYGLRLNDIRKVLRREQKSTKGLIFGYISPNEDFNKPQQQKKLFFEEELNRKKEATLAKIANTIKPAKDPVIIKSHTYKIFGIPVWTTATRIERI